jgi:hypothetical protein
VNRLGLVALGGLLAAVPACSSSAPHHAAPPTTSTTRAAVPTSSTTSTAPLEAAGGPVPSGFEAASVTFVSAAQGFVLGGSSSCPTTPCTSLVRTKDAGQSWQGVPAPGAPLGAGQSGSGDTLSRVRFADARDGWAFGPALWSTHDGAQSWHPVQINGRVLDLAAAKGAVFALVSECTDAGGACSSAPLQLFRSAVGSDQFVPVAAVHGVGTEPALIELAGPDAYIAAGRPAADGLASAVFASTDGYASWHALADPCDTAGALALTGLAGTPDGRTLFELCSGNAAAGSTQKQVYLSTDNGSTSHLVGNAPTGGDAEAIAAAGARDLSVTATSGADFIYTSLDGGSTWKTVTLQPGGAGLADLGFTTSTQGVVVEGHPAQQGGAGIPPASLLMSHDGGLSWQAVAIR